MTTQQTDPRQVRVVSFDGLDPDTTTTFLALPTSTVVKITEDDEPRTMPCEILDCYAQARTYVDIDLRTGDWDVHSMCVDHRVRYEVDQYDKREG